MCNSCRINKFERLKLKSLARITRKIKREKTVPLTIEYITVGVNPEGSVWNGNYVKHFIFPILNKSVWDPYFFRKGVRKGYAINIVNLL